MNADDLDERKRVESAAKHGDTCWGKYGSVFDHERYALPIQSRCRCRACPGRGMKRPRVTHAGRCNGITLMTGCEWHVRQWVREQGRTYGKPGPPLPINPWSL